jgi:hypothetical protein
LSFARPQQAVAKKLERAHESLDRKQQLADNYRSFVNEQRFSAFMLEAAIASSRSELKGIEPQKSLELGVQALDKFDAALSVDGHSTDADARELKGLQLRNLGQGGLADSEFGALQILIEQQIDSAVASGLSVEKLTVQLLRVMRYQIEIDHGNGDDVPANVHGLNALGNARLKSILGPRGDLNSILERARFNEAHGCARAKAYGIAIGGVAETSLNWAIRDYDELRQRLASQKKSWFRGRNVSDLERLAPAGLARIALIKAKPDGTGCPHHHSPDTTRSPNPAQ